MKKKLVGIVMGSDSDLAIMQDAAKILEQFGVGYEITVLSAHRTPDEAFRYARGAGKRGFKALIAGAGGAAHLAGVLAAITTLPVIGVPVKSKNLEGLDSLLSTAQMPPGIPVATVAINGAKNAGILAAQILALGNPALARAVSTYRAKMRKEVNLKSGKLKRAGYRKYLES